MRIEIDILSRVKFKAEEVLPISTIREHSKTDDTPLVTDHQIELYRAMSFEQAELYTGRIIFGNASVMERFYIDGSDEGRLRPRRTQRIKLNYAPMERKVIVSDFSGMNKSIVHANLNSRKLEVPQDCVGVNMGACCAGHGMEYQAQVLYTTGYRDKDDIPNTILYGCLKLLTWSIFNPGDELLTVRNRLGTTETGLIGTNNGAWASGAIEHWKTYQVN